MYFRDTRDKSNIRALLIKIIKRHLIKIYFCIGWLTLLVSFLVDFYNSNTQLWFPRSGAVLCMLSLMAEFRLNYMDRNLLVNSVEEALNQLKVSELGLLKETAYEKRVKLFAHVSVGVGTIVWAYGDLFV